MKRSLVTITVFTFLVLQSAYATLVTVADSVAEFSGTRGSDNWYYGYRTNTDGTLGGTFGAFTQMTDFYSSQWRRDVSGSINPSYLLLGQQNSHPDNDASSESGTFEFSARRWVSEVSGEIAITGTVRKTYIGDGRWGIPVMGLSSQFSKTDHSMLVWPDCCRSPPSTPAPTL